MSHMVDGKEYTDAPIVPLPADIVRRAAVRVSDQIGVENPHPLDDIMPRLAAKQLAQDPAVRAGLRELLDALGLLPREAL